MTKERQVSQLMRRVMMVMVTWVVIVGILSIGVFKRSMELVILDRDRWRIQDWHILDTRHDRLEKTGKSYDFQSSSRGSLRPKGCGNSKDKALPPSSFFPSISHPMYAFRYSVSETALFFKTYLPFTAHGSNKPGRSKISAQIPFHRVISSLDRPMNGRENPYRQALCSSVVTNHRCSIACIEAETGVGQVGISVLLAWFHVMSRAE